MTTQQPEALRLAEILEGDYCPDWFYEQGVDEVAAELRRQHARIAELEAQLEAIGAGGVSGPLMGCAPIAASAWSEPVAWRELCRRLYVELFYCNQQMTSGKRPKWQQGKTVRDVLADAKAALDAAPQPTPTPQADSKPAPAAVAGPHVTDAMALAFHSALSDGAIGSDEVEEIKAGLRAALAAAPTTQPALRPAVRRQPTEALARAEYYIDNPSAWSSFDQRISDDISDVTNALRAALAALNDAATSLETIAHLAGRTAYGTPPIETNMETLDKIRIYAAARALVASAAQECSSHGLKT